MAGYTTAMCGSFKAEAPDAGHCFSAPISFTANLNSTTALAAISSTVGLVHGMPISGTNIAANTFLLNNAGTWLLSIAATGTASGVTLSAIGDVFKIALGIPSPTGTYGASTTNYSNLTGNSDEVSGTGYTATGQVLATNITPQNTGAAAFWQWSANPSWTGATFSAGAAIVYNTSFRLAGAGRSVSVHSFGGTQTVTGGTFTLVQPSNAAATSLLQIN